MPRHRITVLRAVLFAALVVLVFTGCSKKFPQQVTDVNTALAQAKDSCATVYAKSELGAVQSDVDQMNGLADDQKYKKARKAAEPLLPHVQDVETQATKNRAMAKKSAEGALAGADGLFAKARQAEASKYASSQQRAADAKLAEAKAAFNDPCRYGEAEALAKDAGKLAQTAATAAVAEKERQEREARLAEERRRKEEEARRLREAEEAKNRKPATWSVEKGNSLWEIAGLEKVYGDPTYWPILFDANRDAVGSDPNLIYPGITLDVPRMDEAKMEQMLHELWGELGTED